VALDPKSPPSLSSRYSAVTSAITDFIRWLSESSFCARPLDLGAWQIRAAGPSNGFFQV
jgi:hypothetical protein